MRLRRLAFPLVLALGVAVVAGPAFAQEDDDDLTFEQSIIHSLLGGNSGPAIDYRERSPLVIPPARDLPVPGSAEAVAANPAWPHDADQKKKTKVSGPRSAAAAIDREGLPLSPDELRRGTVAGARAQRPARTVSDGDMGRPMMPTELNRGEQKTLFGLLTRVTGMETPEPFAGEPARSKLTQPPAGYRTPVGNQPYAPPQSKSWLPHVPTFFERTEKSKDN